MKLKTILKGIFTLSTLFIALHIMNAESTNKVEASTAYENIRYNIWALGKPNWEGAVPANTQAGVSGTHMRGFGIYFTNFPQGVGFRYRIHTNNGGWLPEKVNGANAEATGSGYIEAVRIKLNSLSAWTVRYRVRRLNGAWSNWVENWATAGTFGHEIDAIEIRVFTYCAAGGGHLFSNNVCVNSVQCGIMNTSNTDHFQHYMFRAGNLARRITNGWLGYPGHRAIDIATPTPGQVMGWKVYAQGDGIVLERSGTNPCSLRGHWIAIRYDTGQTVRYLHLQTRPSPAKDERVTRLNHIGNVGNTAVPSSPGHLHIDVNWQNDFWSSIQSGIHVDPNSFFPAGVFN